ncbi:hypothetical protein HaLaN_28684, partial [Haematococcus lacustris]
MACCELTTLTFVPGQTELTHSLSDQSLQSLSDQQNSFNKEQHVGLPTKLIQQGTTCWAVGNLTPLQY